MSNNSFEVALFIILSIVVFLGRNACRVGLIEVSVSCILLTMSSHDLCCACLNQCLSVMQMYVKLLLRTGDNVSSALLFREVQRRCSIMRKISSALRLHVALRVFTHSGTRLLTPWAREVAITDNHWSFCPHARSLSARYTVWARLLW